VLALVERPLVLQVLHHTGGNQSQAARILGLTRKTLRAKFDSLGISVEHSTSVEEGHAS
jgi:DNA-binding protein Fis